MRKLIFIVVILVLLALGYFGYAHFSGGAVPTFGLPLGGERALIRNRVGQLWEGIRFNDMNAVARISMPERNMEGHAKQDVEELLGTSISNVVIEQWHINEIELDSDDRRARVDISATVRYVQEKNTAEKDFVLYFHKSTIDQHWYWLLGGRVD